MKKLLSIAISIVMIFTLSGSGVFATVNSKMLTTSITKVYTFTRDPSTPASIVFEGKVTNKTKYLATIKTIKINIDVTTTEGGTYKKSVTWDPKNLMNNTEFKSLLPSVVKANGFVTFKLRNYEASQIKKPLGFLPTEYTKTTYLVDFGINATTTKTTKILNKAASSGKVVKTLKTKTIVAVLDVATKGYIKIKYGTTTGYVLVTDIK